MKKQTKILIAGVGGQGIVYLSNIIVNAAMSSGIPVSVSEIHGLSQRGGIVTSGIGLGEYCTGFIGNAGADYLIGLEPLETQRCLPYLHQDSVVVYGGYTIAPYAVNAETVRYPEMEDFYSYINTNCREVIFVREFPESLGTVLYNIFLLGVVSSTGGFPLSYSSLKEAIQSNVSDNQKGRSLNALAMGASFKKQYTDQ